MTWWEAILAAENGNEDRRRYEAALARVRYLEMGNAYGLPPDVLAKQLAELAAARRELFEIIFPQLTKSQPK